MFIFEVPIFTTYGFILLEIFRNWLYFRNLANHAANKINQVVSNTRVNPLNFPVEMWNHRLFILKKKMGLEFLVPCAEAATVHVASEFVFGSYRGQFQKQWKNIGKNTIASSSGMQKHRIMFVYIHAVFCVFSRIQTLVNNSITSNPPDSHNH